jgi:ABC-type transporter Mla subunit MlaD
MTSPEPTRQIKQVSVKSDTEPAKPKGRPAAYLREIGKLGGRPKAVKDHSATIQSGQAFEKASEQVASVTLDLAERVQQLVRLSKKDKALAAHLNQTSTAFGIWFDKLHKLQAGNSEFEVALPVTLSSQITKRLADQAQANQPVTAKVAVPSQDSHPDSDQLRQAQDMLKQALCQDQDLIGL